MSVYGPGAVTVASPVKRHATNPRSPGRLLGGTRKVSGRTLVCVETVASARHGTRRYGLCAVPGPGPLLVKVRFTFDRPANVFLSGKTDTGQRRYCFGYS